MRRYAVVGGIGAGKSTVCRMLAQHGGRVIDVDRLGHQVLRRAGMRRQLSARFGAGILADDGSVDRGKLGKRVFADPERLRDLNAMVHPEIGRLLRRRMRALAARKVKAVFIDAALFLDLDLGLAVDAVIAVTAPRALRRRRLMQRDGLSAAECEARLRSQPRIGVWTRRSDFRLDTRGSLAEVRARVEDLWRRLERHRRQRGG